MKDAIRSFRPSLGEDPRFGRISAVGIRSSRLACASRRSKSFIVAYERPKGSSRSTPLVFATSVIAGAGFEPATFGL